MYIYLNKKNQHAGLFIYFCDSHCFLLLSSSMWLWLWLWLWLSCHCHCHPHLYPDPDPDHDPDPDSDTDPDPHSHPLGIYMMKYYFNYDVNPRGGCLHLVVE